LLAVELGVYLTEGGSGTLTRLLAVAFFLTSMFYVHRSFFGMRIESDEQTVDTRRQVAVKA